MITRQKKFTIAICYDFDGTLSPNNMQEYSFIPKLQEEPKNFWADTGKIANQQDSDLILSYMYLMCRRAKEQNIKIRREDFVNFGKQVEFFKGLTPEYNKESEAGELFLKTIPDWFERTKNYAKSLGADLKHIVISSGLKEMIEGSKIGNRFDKIFASSFMYDENGVAVWPAQAINYTTKMQFLFRINKGVWDIQKTINHYMPEKERPVPFKRMIYIGDGMTDIPAMKLVKSQGGYSIAVHDGSRRKGKSSEKLLNEDRVNFVAKADYSQNSLLERQVMRVIAKIAAEKKVEDA